MSRTSFPVVALLTLVLASPVLAQTCQTWPGLTYGTYVDAAGATQPLQLELLVPQGVSGPVPVVLWIHGGGWKSGSRLPVPARASNLCARGYAVASVDYRLTAAALWPAQIQDVRGAVRWLRAHASEYGLDVDSFAAWGDSAGGHLAAMLAFSGGAGTVTVGSVTLDLEGSTGGNPDQSSRVQAVVDWYGATDFLQMHFYPTTSNHDASSSDESRLLGGAIQDRPELAATANPIFYVDPDDPPLLVLHGTVDKINPFNQSQLLVDAVRGAGIQARLVPVQGAGHGGSAFDKTANLQIVYDFLDSILKGSAPLTAGDPTTHPSDPPGPVTLAASDRFAAESGADGGGRITFTRTGGTGGMALPLTVAYTVSGTATPGDDYAELSGSVTIPAGQASAGVDVTPLDDDLYETGETVILTAGSSSASVVIRDVEAVRPVVTVSPSDQDAAEPSDAGGFIVWRTGSTTDPLTVDLIHGGTASASDYDLPASATIPAGSDRVLLAVTPRSDTLVEDPETVTLAVAADPAIYPGPYTGSTVTIADGPPLVLSSLTLTPATFTGGCKTSTGKVTLSAKAPIGGFVVTLSNTNPVATVPPSVTVPAGSISATFTITAPAVTANKAGTVTASQGGNSLSGALTVRPIGVATLALSPNPVLGPSPVTGTVTLECPAAPGSIVVALSSSSPAVANPAASSLTIPAGSTQGTFTVTTADVSIQSSASIKAVASGITKSLKLTVNP